MCGPFYIHDFLRTRYSRQVQRTFVLAAIFPAQKSSNPNWRGPGFAAHFRGHAAMQDKGLATSKTVHPAS